VRAVASGFPHRTHLPTITLPLLPISKERQRGSWKAVPSKNGSPQVRFSGSTVNVCFSSIAIHIIPPDGPLSASWLREECTVVRRFLALFVPGPTLLMSSVSSTIIQDIEVMCDAGQASMGYFYFDFRDTDKQHGRDLVTSLLHQLSAGSGPRRDILSRLHATHEGGARQPSDQELTNCLKEMLTLSDQCPAYLIIDGLNESDDTSGIPSPREHVLQLVKDLVELCLPDLHICVTSRPHPDIEDVFEPLTPLRVSLHDERGQRKDITDYVRSVVYSNSERIMRRWRKEEKDLVIETLSNRADGM
jgi:hypothetical protein